MAWNYGDIFESVMDTVPGDHIALIGDGLAITWPELERRTYRLAQALLARGLCPGDKVALYMRNSPAYIETVIACFRAGFVHVNVNYRYREQELHFLLADSDSAAIVFDAEFQACLDAVPGALPELKVRVVHGNQADNGPNEAYETLASAEPAAPQPFKRTAKDLFFIYTGGTTGMPKGVMWAHNTLISAQLEYNATAEGLDIPRDIAAFTSLVTQQTMAQRQLPAPPLMHATGILAAIGVLMFGGSVVTLNDRQGFSADAIWRAVSNHQVTHLTIVGDAFANPLIEALQQPDAQYPLDKLRAIISSGAAWSKDSKARILAVAPHLMLVDSLGSSEAPACALSVTTADSRGAEPVFMRTERCRVFTDEDEEVLPGSDQTGYLAMCGHLPEGYYKDPAKTARTFRRINGQRYAFPGDLCRVQPDGRLVFLGRGSQCINTGGEKVFVEEVEQVLKTHPTIRDALVFGTPDHKWGQAVTAVVALHEPQALDHAAVCAHVKTQLAGYKVPKQIFATTEDLRLANGKADYAAARNIAQEAGATV